MTLERLSVPNDWHMLITNYLASQRAGGAPATTLETRRQHLSHLARGIQLTPADIDGPALVEWASTQTWARETRRSRRSTFRSFWGWAVTAGHLDIDAAAALPAVKPLPPSPRAIPAPVLDAAHAAADARTRLILRLACELGLRRAEIAALHRRDVIADLVGYSLRVYGKGGRVRVLPLPDSLARVLRSHDGYIFPGRDGGHLSPRWVGKLASSVLPDAWTLHAGRHRFATLAHRECGDLLIVQDLLGHASPVTTRHYVEPDTRRARAIVERLAA